eukprot:m.74133 g.74133  ORF g.74133 m.74133 type:complete len:373 (-) comp12448_c0_seq2:1024-2142(-)
MDTWIVTFLLLASNIHQAFLTPNKDCQDRSICNVWHPGAFQKDWGPVLKQIAEFNATSRSPCWEDEKTGRYVCLPGLMVLGVNKCGTSDFYEKITKYPAIFRPIRKDPHWWTRIARPVSFRSYLAELLYKPEQNILLRERDGISLDASASTFWDRGNLGVPTPSLHNLLAPEVLGRILGNRTRFVVLYRDPTERLISSYLHFHGKPFRGADFHNVHINHGEKGAVSGEEFHERVVQALTKFNDCKEKRSDLECAYLTVRHAESRPLLAPGLYATFLEVWLRYIPSSRIMLIKSEEYYKHSRKVLERFFKFMELPLPDENRWEKILAGPIANTRKQHLNFTAPEKTRILLDKFYKPYNEQLDLLLLNRSVPNV